MTAVPLVDYLVLGDKPHLEAEECTACGARFFGRRNACAACGAREFRRAAVDTEGEVKAFSIVTFASPGVEVPFVAATIDCGGTTVAGNIVGVKPSPEEVHLGQKVRLVTFSMGNDDNGTEGVAFGFEPIEKRSNTESRTDEEAAK